MKTLSTCLLAAVVVFATTTADAARVKRLRRMVVVGDSLLSGFGSGGLVAKGRPGQIDSAPAFIARRARVALPQPLMSSPGVPAQYVIVDANRNGVLDRGEVRRPTSSVGFRSDTDQRVRNLAVPGEDSASVFETVSAADVAGSIFGGNVDGRQILKFLILGIPSHGDSVSQPSLARDLHPSFLLVWLGNNDVLPMATETNPDATTVGATEFGSRFRRLLNALPAVGMAVANLPDPTRAPVLRRAAGEVTACRMPNGQTQPVAADDLLSIDLDPQSLPTPPCGKVLDSAEQAFIHTKIAAYNAEVAAAVTDVGQSRGINIALVDVAGAVDDLAAHGVDLDNNGTPDLTTRYLGGIFSLDGVHPTRTGQALIANLFIDAINTRFGEQIPRVDVARVASRDRLAHSRFRPSGEVPFGLIGDTENDDLASFFDDVFGRIADQASSLGRRIRRIFNRFF